MLLSCLTFLLSIEAKAAESPQELVREVGKMLENGIDEEVIMAKIRKQKVAVDLSADEMIFLKKAGASPAVLKALIEPAPEPKDNQDSSDTRTEEGADSFYMYVGTEKTLLQRAHVDLNAKVNPAFIVTGGAKAHMILSKSGPTANVRTTNSVPQFGELDVPLHLRVEEHVQLIRFELNGDKQRRWEAAKGGPFSGVKPSSKNAVAVTFEEIAQRKSNGKQVRVYKVKPSSPLQPGEYAIVISMQKCFDFGIDAP